MTFSDVTMDVVIACFEIGSNAKTYGQTHTYNILEKYLQTIFILT